MCMSVFIHRIFSYAWCIHRILCYGAENILNHPTAECRAEPKNDDKNDLLVLEYHPEEDSKSKSMDKHFVRFDSHNRENGFWIVWNSPQKRTNEVVTVGVSIFFFAVFAVSTENCLAVLLFFASTKNYNVSLILNFLFSILILIQRLPILNVICLYNDIFSNVHHYLAVK